MIISPLLIIAALTLSVVGPQAVGVLASFLCRHSRLWLRLAISILLPPFVYFAVAYPYCMSLVPTVVAGGERPCGLLAFIFVFTAFGGTVGHFSLAFLLHVGAVLEQRAFAGWSGQ